VWHHLCPVDVLLRLNLVRTSAETIHHASDPVLELAVLGGVDERVDTADGELQHNAEVVEPVNSVTLLMQKTRKYNCRH